MNYFYKEEVNFILTKNLKLILKQEGHDGPWVAHLSIKGTKLFQNLSTSLAEEVV